MSDYRMDVIRAAREAIRQMDFFGSSKRMAIFDCASCYMVNRDDIEKEIDAMRIPDCEVLA